ncbi:tyrosine-type recombinase/integrase [Bacillus amyloliquefaciens]|uniref:tyrosine-type recombinase/integrase n=1 Tax=Bacillus amyloliquefaciens TaxID=1390 RepID=UPI000AB93D58|nr:tyrosine-type recombinase/integrase [Bacillus amyloliquefaciens]MDH3090626.1 tyrosine-type recombinase/integrase [Bacillus amyloliquefaciens]
MSLYITVVKSFYLWLEDERKISVNPLLVHSIADTNKTFNKTKLLYGQVWKFDIEKTLLSRVTYRKKREHLKWYTEKEIETIRKNLPTIRDEAVFAISVETGMRIGEILGLKMKHFNRFEATLEIVRERNIENRTQVKTAERTIQRAYADINFSNFLFLNLKGKHMGNPLKPRNFLRILKDSGEKSGLKRNEIRTHSGRSTRVQQLVELMRDKPELGITQTFIDEELGWRSERSIKSYERGYSMSQKRKILERIKNVSIDKGED